ncbi:MAG: ArnT family glycosyltransferase [Candidatus Brocadiales bacterium]
MIILVMIGMASFLPNLAGRDLWEPDELRCAEVAREMLADGNWIVPHLEGEIYPDKPPLFFWLIAISSSCLGGLSAFAVRLPSALAGIGGMLIIFFFGKRLGNKWTGFLASLILAAMPCYFAMSITARMDILLTFFVSSALYCFYLAYSGYSSWFYILFYFLMGMGTLTKGPVGFFIPFLAVLSYLSVRGEWKNILRLKLIPGFLVFTATVAAWLVPAIIQGGRDYAHEILFNQNVGRYVGGQDHQNPFTYYFIILPLILMPWTPLLPGVFITTIKERLLRNRVGARHDVSLLPLMWLITTFVFFSCSGSRGRIYLLPVLPAVSLSVALLLQMWSAECGVRSEKTPLNSTFRNPQSAFGRRLALTSYLVISGLLIAFAIAAPSIIKHVRPSVFTIILPIVGILGAGSIACLVLTICKAYKTSLIVFVGMVLIVSFTFCFRVLPIESHDRSVRTLFAEISRVMKAGDDLRTYRISRTGYSYYWGDVLKRISNEEELRKYLNGNTRAFCLMREKHYNRIRQNPDSPISVVLKMHASRKRFVLVTSGTPTGVPITEYGMRSAEYGR